MSLLELRRSSEKTTRPVKKRRRKKILFNVSPTNPLLAERLWPNLEKSVARARTQRKCAYFGKEGATCDTDRNEDLELIWKEGGDMGIVYFCATHRNFAFTMAADMKISEDKTLLAFGKNFTDDPRVSKQ